VLSFDVPTQHCKAGVVSCSESLHQILSSAERDLPRLPTEIHGVNDQHPAHGRVSGEAQIPLGGVAAVYRVGRFHARTHLRADGVVAPQRVTDTQYQSRALQPIGQRALYAIPANHSSNSVISFICP
jgi:hypothetical protein